MLELPLAVTQRTPPALTLIGPPVFPSKDRVVESKAARDDLREVLNADRRRRFGASGRLLALVCECGDASCRRTILMTPAEYDAQQPGLILHAAHDVPSR